MKTKIIACSTVGEEIVNFIGDDVEYEALDFGLHIHPEKLQATLQEEIDKPTDAEVILLGYGICSKGALGLVSSQCKLVIPKVDDCIAIFLGSKDEYLRQQGKEPGTYYLTKGWIECADDPYSAYQKLEEKYGEDNARYVTESLLKNYTRLALIDTGVYKVDEYLEYAEKVAKMFDLRFEVIPGSTAIIEKMLSRQWDNEFIVVEPNQKIELEMFWS